MANIEIAQEITDNHDCQVIIAIGGTSEYVREQLKKIADYSFKPAQYNPT